ncbi:SpoIIE family protein phosphatase [candidate division KSB1 bacterium]|nr:SpoIIE family protein phosphatase [candidate division KSB1 bacterium]
MSKTRSHKDIVIALLAIIGLVVFITLIGQVYPYKAVQFTIDRQQAIAIATKYMEQRGYDLSDYRVSAITQGSDQAFHYLQDQVGLEEAMKITRYEAPNLFSYYWHVFWYQNLPRSAPQESYSASVSPDGRVFSFNHSIPRDAAPALGNRSRLIQPEALARAEHFLVSENLDPTSFIPDEFTSQQYEKRTDHIFRWRRDHDKIPGEIKLYVHVQGEEISNFSQWFELPKAASLKMKEADTRHFIAYSAAMVLFFLFSLLPIMLFLKKYHEGEVGVRTAFIIFWLVYVSTMIYQLLAIPIQAIGWGLGELSYDYITIVKLIFSAFMIVPFLAVVSFASWSVGESYAREKWADKLVSFDAIITGHLKTLSFAASAARGYAFGFISLGLTVVFTYLCIHFFGATVGITGYESTITFYWPFLIPFINALSSVLICELVCRLFANLYFFKLFKREWIAAFLSAIIFAVIVIPIWGVPWSITPTYLLILLAFINGLFFAYLFWQYDLITAIFANFTLIGVLTVVPIISNSAPNLITTGYVALAFLFFPFIVIALGYIYKQKFIYRPETMPAHIRRISERVRMARELEIARQVQIKLLPKTSPMIPGCDVAGLCIPAQEVGGDYFDFIQLDEHKLGITIGDVSGKGVPAAIYMTLTKGVFQSHAEANVSPKVVLTKVNSLLYRTIERDSFVSMFYAVIDLEQGRMVYARAGHNPAIYFSRMGNRFAMLESAGLALGLEKGALFDQIIKEEVTQLQSGDLLVLYTDGFTEAMNKNQQEFTETKLLDVVNTSKHLPAQEIITAVQNAIKEFVGDVPQHDDMTMVVVKIS